MVRWDSAGLYNSSTTYRTNTQRSYGHRHCLDTSSAIPQGARYLQEQYQLMHTTYTFFHVTVSCDLAAPSESRRRLVSAREAVVARARAARLLALTRLLHPHQRPCHHSDPRHRQTSCHPVRLRLALPFRRYPPAFMAHSRGCGAAQA